MPEAQSHYLKNVLRRTEGDQVRLFNAADGEWLAAIRFQGKKALAAELSENIRLATQDSRELHLFFSPIKKERNDLLIEKAVELGVTHFHPVLFQRTIVRDVKEERILAQMIEAAEQCERLDIPHLLPLLDLKKSLAKWEEAAPLFAAIERVEASPLTQQSLPKAGFLIGPEGGITADEIDDLKAKAFIRPVSLGSRILRAETAAFYGLSLLTA